MRRQVDALTPDQSLQPAGVVGQRVLVQKIGGVVIGINRRGLGLSATVVARAASMSELRNSALASATRALRPAVAASTTRA